MRNTIKIRHNFYLITENFKDVRIVHDSKRTLNLLITANEKNSEKWIVAPSESWTVTIGKFSDTDMFTTYFSANNLIAELGSSTKVFSGKFANVYNDFPMILYLRKIIGNFNEPPFIMSLNFAIPNDLKSLIIVPSLGAKIIIMFRDLRNLAFIENIYTVIAKAFNNIVIENITIKDNTEYIAKLIKDALSSFFENAKVYVFYRLLDPNDKKLHGYIRSIVIDLENITENWTKRTKNEASIVCDAFEKFMEERRAISSKLKLIDDNVKTLNNQHEKIKNITKTYKRARWLLKNAI